MKKGKGKIKMGICLAMGNLPGAKGGSNTWNPRPQKPPKGKKND